MADTTGTSTSTSTPTPTGTSNDDVKDTQASSGGTFVVIVKGGK